MKLEFCGQIFRKMLKYQILLNFVYWERREGGVGGEGQGDRHDEANSRSSQFCQNV